MTVNITYRGVSYRHAYINMIDRAILKTMAACEGDIYARENAIEAALAILYARFIAERFNVLS